MSDDKKYASVAESAAASTVVVNINRDKKVMQPLQHLSGTAAVLFA